MSRLPTRIEVTTQSGVPTQAQCVAIPNHVETVQVYAEMDTGVATGVEHNVYAILRTEDNESPLLIENFPDLETIATRGKYVYELPVVAGMSIVAVGVQLVEAVGAITDEQVYVSIK